MGDLPDLSDVVDGRALAWPGADAVALADAIEAAGWVVLSLPAPATNRITEDLVERVEQAARALYPAWLHEAEGIGSLGGGGEEAVRSIARRTAESSALFSPYLEALAVAALNREHVKVAVAVPSEVRLRESYKLFLRSYGVARAILLISVPGDYPREYRSALEHTVLWIASQPSFPVWLVGDDLDWLERIPRAPSFRRSEPGAAAPIPAPHVTPLSGRPNPFSDTEKRLEAYLARCDWSSGRAWNKPWSNGALGKPIRVDLMWAQERLVVELDGPEHIGPARYADDRRRDRILQAAGFRVLRFTNEEVQTDISRVASEIEQFLKTARDHGMSRRDG